jgi:DNA-binding Lrp family transcriptional regulator
MTGPRYSIIPAAAVKDARVSLGAKAVLGVLGTHTDKNGWCHPKQGEIAAALGVSREYVVRCIRTLVERGYVETRSFNASRRGRVALEYRVKMDLPDEIVQAAENSRCEPDVIEQSHRPAKPLKLAVVTEQSQRGRCDQVITADVITQSHRNITDKRPHNNDPKDTPGFDEIWGRWPRKDRSSKAKSKTIWLAAAKRHGAAAAVSAVDAYLASPDALKEAAAYVPALERWLRDKLDAWVEIAAARPASAAVDLTDYLDSILGKEASNG